MRGHSGLLPAQLYGTKITKHTYRQAGAAAGSVACGALAAGALVDSRVGLAAGNPTLQPGS